LPCNYYIHSAEGLIIGRNMFK